MNTSHRDRIQLLDIMSRNIRIEKKKRKKKKSTNRKVRRVKVFSERHGGIVSTITGKNEYSVQVLA